VLALLRILLHFCRLVLIFGRVLYQDIAKKVVVGENSERALYGNAHVKTHAEVDALRKLEGIVRCKKMKKTRMNLIVLRVNKSGNLCESAPCYHCTMELVKNSCVTIDRLYYSRADGSITCVKFSNWTSQKNFHVSKGWKWIIYRCYRRY
jgi:hypothetical protein